MPRDFPDIPVYIPNHEKLLRQIVRVISNLMQGRSNNIHTITLNASATTTNINLPIGELGEESVIVFMPTTANAATEFGAGSMYVSARSVLTTTSTFTITHANTAATDKIFDYIIVG